MTWPPVPATTLGFPGRASAGQAERGAEGRRAVQARPLLQLARSPQPLRGRDVVRVEPIQQKVTGMIKGMENQAHEERLKGLPLFSLEKRDSD